VAVVHNPTKVDLEALREAVTAAESSYGFEPSLWFETTAEDPGTSMAKEAVDQGADIVIAAGGDGTVRAVAEGLRGSDAALALVPSGTGNLLARNLEHRLDDLEHSIDLAFGGEDRSIDLGIATIVRPDGERDELVFAVMAGIGLDAQMIVNQDEDLKKKAGWLAYVKSLGASMKGGRRIKLRLTVDDGSPHVSRVHTLLVGNCGALPANIVLLPDAEVDDGVLDVVALRPDGLLGWITIWAKILVEHGIMRRGDIGRKLVGGPDGAPKNIRALRYLRGSSFRVQLRDPEEFELDGDAFGEVREFTTTLEPGGLTVRV